jgi:predicted dehydrogenase
MSRNKLRVGIIGIGWYAANALIPSLRTTERVEIVALARRRQDLLHLAQRELNVAEGYTDWREMLEQSKLDAVVVATPPNAHAEPSLAALRKGLHVFVEKPMTLLPEEAQAMAETAAQTDRVLMVGYNARSMGSWRTIKRLLDAGAIGTVRQVTVTACVDVRILWQEMVLPEWMQQLFASSEFLHSIGNDLIRQGNWRTLPEVAGAGMLADIGSHIQDLMLWLANGSAVQVSSFAQSTGSPAIISALARLDNGVLLSIAFNDAVSGGEEFKFYGNGCMTLYGDRGMITAGWTGMMTTEASEIWLEQDGIRTQVEPEFETVHPAAAFVAAILDGAPNSCPASEAARVVALTEAIYRSAAEEQVVRLAGLTRD